MGESKRYKLKRGAGGELIKLTLVKVRDYKKVSLYQVMKVEGNELIPLYKETFTPEQVEEFYNPPSNKGCWKYVSSNGER